MKNNWSDKYQWCFGPLSTGDKVGVNNAGIGIFKKLPYIGLAKEILQNVLDASDPDIKEPAKACFEVIRVNRTDIPGAERLYDVIKRCHDFYHDGEDGKKMGIVKKAAENFLDKNETIPVLKISDYNTVGLTGVHGEKGTNWTGLVREVCATNKGNGLSGSFGVGKFAPFNFSAIRTIVYSTLNKEGETALQGKTILTTFKDNDGKLKQNVGLFGKIEEDDCKAIYDNQDIPPLFRRKECGTDLFVLGFKEDSDWMEQVAISVLDYFFYTIFKGNLEVSIIDGAKNISITKENLGELIESYNKYCEEHMIEFSAPLFLELLIDTSGKTKHFKEIFNGMGEVELYLRMDPDFSERRILEMRKAGMKIQEDVAFRIGAYFRGIFIATGNNSKSDDPGEDINSFLRNCENLAHDTWSKDEYEEKKEEATKLIREIHAWILKKVKSEMPEVEEDEIKGYGLDDLLPSVDKLGEENQEEKVFSSFEPLSINLSPSKARKNRKKVSDVSLVLENKQMDLEETINIPDDNGDMLLGENGNGLLILKPNPNPGPEPKPGPKPGPKPEPPYPMPFSQDLNGDVGEEIRTRQETQAGKQGKKILKKIYISNIKTPYDAGKDAFRIIFISSKTANDVHIKLRIGADDDDKRDAIIKAAFQDNIDLVINKGYIVLNHIEKNKKIIFTAKLANAKRCPLEVTAYAE